MKGLGLKDLGSVAALWRVCLGASLALALGGCVSSNGPGDPTSYSQALFGNPTGQQPEKPLGPQRDLNCPSVDVLEGTAAHRVGGATVSYQASLLDVARECNFGGSQFTMRVGVQGRVVLGASGKPGTFSVPVRIAVKRGDKVVTSRLSRISVSVPAGQGGASFAHVEEGISLPVGAEDPSDEYDVLVGFDGGASAASTGRRRR